jgi:hypothetical protein
METMNMIKQKMYTYTAFGLVINSEFFLPELEYSEEKADVSIIEGPLMPSKTKPDDLEGPNCNFMISPDEFTFFIAHLAKFSIQNGSRIVIEPYKNADLQTIRAYLLGMGLGILLIQKGLIPVHGSAVTVAGKAVIFTGNNGAGKTTLCSWFQKYGYGYLADDISAIKFDNCRKPMVQPGFSQQRVCENTAAKLNLNVRELPQASMHDDKYIIDNKRLFISRPAPLQSIVEIMGAENSRPTIRKITGIEKIHYLMRNIYCAGIYQGIGFNNEFFESCLQIVKQINIYQLQRPKGTFSAEEQMQLVIDALFNC